MRRARVDPSLIVALIGGAHADCPRCATAHHAPCFAEAGGCTVFGCAEVRQPVREEPAK